jgi:hypothetical protein
MMRSTLLAAIVVLAFGSGCAQVMAYKQPAPIDRDLLTGGADRSSVIGLLGPPVVTEESDERLSDTYSYTDGGAVNATGWKALRILLYTAGDVFTLFLDQVLWIPAELLMDGTKYSATVEYERSGSRRWVAERMIEQEMEGDNEVAVVFEEEPDANDFAAMPLAVESAPASGVVGD